MRRAGFVPAASPPGTVLNAEGPLSTTPHTHRVWCLAHRNSIFPPKEVPEGSLSHPGGRGALHKGDKGNEPEQIPHPRKPALESGDSQ